MGNFVMRAKALRKAISLAMSAVELDAEDIAVVADALDSWEPSGKHKKGELAKDGGTVYVCSKNVNKSDIRPSEDSEHWTAVLSGSTAPTWESGAKYKRGDQVAWPAGGTVWICQKNNTKEEPGTGGDWEAA